jgi:type III restriction enzyme
VLEVENTLTWGFDSRRSKYVFPLHNLSYEPEQKTVQGKQEQAKEPDVKFNPQDRKTTEYSTFSETGKLAVVIEHDGLIEVESAVKRLSLFLREKDEKIAAAWPKKRLREFIVAKLKAAGQEATFLSKENLLRLQYGFSPMFRDPDKEHPRMSQTAKGLLSVDLAKVSRQSFSESMLKEHGALYVIKDDENPFEGHELHLWGQYQKYRKMVTDYPEEASEQAKAIDGRIHQVDLKTFKAPWNVHYASHEPERQFSDLLFQNAALFDAFVKMPNTGGYSFPYSYKPAKAAKTHVTNEHFNPDFFIKVRGNDDILVVEVKTEGDDSNRNKAKNRDGEKHFELLNERLKEAKIQTRYCFYFLSPEDYTSFFEKVRTGKYPGWKSGLMQELSN